MQGQSLLIKRAALASTANFQL